MAVRLSPLPITPSHRDLAARLMTIDPFVHAIIEDVFDQCVRKVEGEKHYELTERQFQALGRAVAPHFISCLKQEAISEICRRLLLGRSAQWCDQFSTSLTQYERGQDPVDPLHKEEARRIVAQIQEQGPEIKTTLQAKGRSYADAILTQIRNQLPTVLVI